MSVSKKDLQLLGFVAGILAIVAVYFLVFSPYREKTNALKAENADLTSKIAELEKLDAQKSDFVQETARLEQEIKEIYMQFPSKVQEEDVIADGIAMEHAAGVANQQINYNPFEIAYTPIAETIDEMPAPPSPIDGTTAQDAVEETADESQTEVEETVASGLTLIKQPIQYTFLCDVTTFLRAADYIAKHNNRDVITAVSIGYDSGTGLLVGRVDSDKYYIQGLSKEYEASSFDSVPKGVYNIFSSLPQGVTPTGENNQEQ